MCLPRRDARDNCDHHDVADVARCSRRHRIGGAPDACPLHFHDDRIKAQTRQITPYINAKPLRLNTPIAIPTGLTVPEMIEYTSKASARPTSNAVVPTLTTMGIVLPVLDLYTRPNTTPLTVIRTPAPLRSRPPGPAQSSG